jgi:hypothetical protein
VQGLECFAPLLEMVSVAELSGKVEQREEGLAEVWGRVEQREEGLAEVWGRVWAVEQLERIGEKAEEATASPSRVFAEEEKA